MWWSRLRPWLGLGVFVFEAVQPLFNRAVEPLIVAGAIAMMGLELLSRADKPKNASPKEQPR
jgi:hypothetical protein